MRGRTIFLTLGGAPGVGEGQGADADPWDFVTQGSTRGLRWGGWKVADAWSAKRGEVTSRMSSGVSL